MNTPHTHNTRTRRRFADTYFSQFQRLRNGKMQRLDPQDFGALTAPATVLPYATRACSVCRSAALLVPRAALRVRPPAAPACLLFLKH